MTPREFLFNITIILTVMAVWALIEIAVPMFIAKPWRQDHIRLWPGLANLLTIYARLLGTYTPSDRAELFVYGLNGAGR